MQPVSPQVNERNVVILTGVAHFSTHFFELMYPTLAVTLAHSAAIPLERVLGWSFLGYLLYGLGAVPAGLLADHLGARVMLIAGMAGMGVGALAASDSPAGPGLSICLGALGLAMSVYHPAGMSLISRTISARGRALGINGIFGNVAIAATPIVTALLCEEYGWQNTYAFAGFTMCVVAVLCAFLRIDEKALPHALAPRRPVSARRHGDKLLFALLCVAAMLAGLSYRGNTVVQPAYFAERVSTLGFGATTSLVYLFGIGGQYVGGVLADRHDLRWLYLGFHALSLPALLLMTWVSGTPLIAVAAVFVFFSLGMQPIENSLFARFTPVRWRATGYGIKFVLTFGVGSLAVQLVAHAQAAGDLSHALLLLAGIVAALVTVIALFAVLSGAPIHNHHAAPAHDEAGAADGDRLPVVS